MAQFEAILRRSHDALDGTLASFFSHTRRSSPRRPAWMARPPGVSHDWAAGARRVVGLTEGDGHKLDDGHSGLGTMKVGPLPQKQTVRLVERGGNSNAC